MVGEDSEDKGGKDPAKLMNVSSRDSTYTTKLSFESDDSETDVASPPPLMATGKFALYFCCV